MAITARELPRAIARRGFLTLLVAICVYEISVGTTGMGGVRVWTPFGVDGIRCRRSKDKAYQFPRYRVVKFEVS